MEATARPAPWRPSLVLTGRSYYGINVCTGKIISHVDVWDSVQVGLAGVPSVYFGGGHYM
jgi:uncharacterized membrane protein